MSSFDERVCSLLTVLTLLGGAVATAQERPSAGVAFRRPSAAALVGKGALLAVANRRSGKVTVLDASSGAIRSKAKVGGELSDLVALPDSTQILLTDFANHELIFATVLRNSVRIEERIPVAHYPVAVAVSPDGQTFAVASLWSRRLSVRQIRNPARLRTTDLPFAPGCVEFISDQAIVVSEAFGGRLGFLDTATPEKLRVHELHVHNIRDLAIRDRRLWFSHQLLRETARTEAEHIHWGVLIENFVSSLDVDSLSQMPNIAKNTLQIEQTRIGDAGDGAGDPSGVAVLSDRVVVTLAGTSQLALIDRVGVREARLPTGLRPVKVVCDEARQRAFVVNSLGDSITIVDLKNTGVVRTVTSGPGQKAGAIERGEAAFFNARLSLENWMSCHSCHTDSHTNNRLADTLGDGDYGNAKRVPSLLGTSRTGPWGWTGSQKTLVKQLQQSFASTMHAPSLPDGVDADLAAYLGSLRPAPSLTAARLASDKDILKSGEMIFRKAGCVECHAGPELTTATVFDVELEDQLGQRRFNPPSLRGVSQRDRLLHDGRARSLHEVLNVHPPGITLTSQERRLLIAYLNEL